MLANVVRRQARVVLTAAARQSTTSLLARIPRPVSLALRPFSTTLCRSDEYAARAQAPAGTPYSDNPPSRQLFLGNLAFEANESDIRDLISQFGEVEGVRIIHNPDGSSRGFAYATFAEQASADQCIQSPLQIFGRQVRVDYSLPPSNRPSTPKLTPGSVARGAQPPGRTLFVGNMPFGTDEPEIREKFEPFGPIKSIRIATRPGGEPRGFAHVEFLREEDAISCYESFVEEPLYMLDRNIRVDYAPTRPTGNNPPSHRLYFYDYRGNEEALRTALNEFETSIQRVHFLRSQANGEITGSGFVEFMSVDLATQAIAQVNGAITPYGPLNLEYAVNRTAGQNQYYNPDQRRDSLRPSQSRAYARQGQNQYSGGYAGGRSQGYGQGVGPSGYGGQGRGPVY
ncbi:hypothetical protein R3P38DRAFT_3266760 [Favolaschia claudopus]|uniref:RRM domain-containing protein n=1 Tax=Favolaschia claudopus TaxID=2862362 RepID=A0AAW0BSX4_9AGAR